jgi:starvation-inducible outer membrane lipoprotein
MKKVAWMLIAMLFFLSGCIVPPGQIKKYKAPGQVKKVTGKNPASGK